MAVDGKRGLAVDVDGLTKTLSGGATLLENVSFSIAPGKVAAIVGGSGAGKTTLLEALAGVRPAERGSVRYDGVDVYRNLDAFRGAIGYVPQDDIIHTELPLQTTLRYAARLRLPPATERAQVDRTVAEVLDQLDLSERSRVRVDSLSGGQRKRASIAVELLTHPHVFFLDEPTSGLDPASGAQLLRLLQRLAASGSTVLLTTHAVQDLAHCDTIVFLAGGGRLAFAGTLPEALDLFEVSSAEGIYDRVATEATPQEWANRFASSTNGAGAAQGPPGKPGALPAARLPGPVRQWTVLSARTAETLARNRLTLAILLGSPVLVVAMFAVLFKPGAFAFSHPSPSATVMIIFWIAFGAFFFGLTYGLLQIVTELPIVRRERLVGLSLGAYVLSKLTVLLPFLLVVDVLMLAVLRVLDRLPAASLSTYLSLGVTLALDAAAALALGLLTSAAVSTPSQATLALPMLCFPAVLFSGAILPVHVMAAVGRVISVAMPDRWAFEAAGHSLHMRHLFADGGSPLGPPLLAAYGSAGRQSVGTYWLILIGFSLVFLVAAWATLVRRCRASSN